MIRLKEIVDGWNRFFFEPISPLPIALFRAATGLLAFINQALLFPDVMAWFSERGTLSFETARHVSGGTGFSLFRWLPHSDAMVWGIYWLSCLFAILLMLGLFSRASALCLFTLLVTLHHRNPVVLNSGDTLLRLSTFYLIFSQAGSAFSIDRLIALARGKASGPPKWSAPWAMRLIQVQLSFVYFYAFVWKIMGQMWLQGTAVYYTARLPEFWRFPVPYIFEHMWTIKLWSWSTLVIEFSLGTLIWIKELRYWVLLGGILLHCGIDYSMNIPLFGFIIVSMYLTFVEPEDLDRFFARARSILNRPVKEKLPAAVLYDAQCSFCTRTIEVIRALDIFHRLDFQGMQSPQTREKFPDFDPKRGEREMLVRRGGRWFGGFDAFRVIARETPLLWIFVPFLYLPRISVPGNWLYQRIAQRRYCVLNHSP